MNPYHGQALQAQRGSLNLGIRRNTTWVYHALGNELLLFALIKGDVRIRRVLYHADRHLSRFAPAAYCPICFSRIIQRHNSLECHGHPQRKLRSIHQVLRGRD